MIVIEFHMRNQNCFRFKNINLYITRLKFQVPLSIVEQHASCLIEFCTITHFFSAISKQDIVKDIIQLMPSFVVNIRTCQSEKVVFTEAARPR